jgi:hypothetical protein
MARALAPSCLASALLASCGQTPPVDATDSSTSSTSGSTASPTTATPTSTSAPTTTGETGTTAAPDDALPPAPTLAAPADGALDVPLSTQLCWNLVDDPDGEPLRYRVFVDGAELTAGVLDDDEAGYAGPCVGPLAFIDDHNFAWNVQAFEVDDPTRASPMSATWTFSTVHVGAATVFADDFEADLGWQVDGDAAAGAWVRGVPERTTDDGALTQPGRCYGGVGCFFTGHNPDALVDQQDVAGGSTVLTSPAFDLGGAAAASVQFARFFYKSDAGPGPRLAVDLLVPDPDVPGEYVAHPLELLTATSAASDDALWRPHEAVVCDAPLVDGSRLRFTASDDGAGILEAAIDSLRVRVLADQTACGAGEGGACDPADASPCPDDLLCCPQGVINEGVHRCTAPVAGLVFSEPTPSPDAPGNGPPGCDAPDLIVDGKWILPIFEPIEVTANSCELYEGCVDGLGARTLMLFTTATPNIGSKDLVMGVAANHPDLFHYSECHDHFHFDEFARYELLAGDVVATTGHKQAFCMLDTVSWAWPTELPRFDCANQGIRRGFSDFYEAGLPCQWIDVSDVAAGEYTLRITLNQPRPDTALPVLVERDYANNTLEVPVTIP